MKNVCKNDHFNTETLQSAANPGTMELGTMELVTQNNAVKSPISDLKQPESKACVYTVEEVAQMLAISLRSAYNFCNTTGEFRVLRVGGSIRIPKDSFDAWLFRAA